MHYPRAKKRVCFFSRVHVCSVGSFSEIPLCIHGWNTLLEYNTLLVSIQDSIIIPDLMEQVGVTPTADTYANLFHGMVEGKEGILSCHFGNRSIALRRVKRTES
jgi:hypothetical protein